MAQKMAIDFVEAMCALFHKYPIQDITKAFYVRKLSRWTLTKGQWDRALDIIIESRGENDRGLPELSEIYPALRKAQTEGFDRNRYGFAYFDLEGCSRAIRIINQDGVWMSMKLMVPVVDIIPANAENFMICPDNPPLPRVEDVPDPAEVKALIANTRKNLGLIPKSRIRPVPVR